MVAVHKMVRSVSMPYGAWPAEMQAKTAAAYVDEPSVESFLKKVPEVYPEPTRTKGALPKWHRAKLDLALARRHGLQVSGQHLIDDAVELI
jgi:hypothetical protein